MASKQNKPSRGPARPNAKADARKAKAEAKIAEAEAAQGAAVAGQREGSGTARPIAGQSRGAAPKPATAAVPGTGPRFKARATRMLYYNHKRRRPGDVFVVYESDFAAHCMERVPSSTPARTTTSGEHLKQEHDEILSGRHGSAAEAEQRDADEELEADADRKQDQDDVIG